MFTMLVETNNKTGRLLRPKGGPTCQASCLAGAGVCCVNCLCAGRCRPRTHKCGGAVRLSQGPVICAMAGQCGCTREAPGALILPRKASFESAHAKVSITAASSSKL